MSTKCITCPPSNFPKGLVCAGKTISVISDRDALTGFPFNTVSLPLAPLVIRFPSVVSSPSPLCSAAHCVKFSFSRYGLAMECMNSGDPAAADGHFRALLEQNADYIPAYLMYGQLLARESRNEEARQVLLTGMAAAAQKGDHHARAEMETLLAELS